MARAKFRWKEGGVVKCQKSRVGHHNKIVMLFIQRAFRYTFDHVRYRPIKAKYLLYSISNIITMHDILWR